MHLSIAINKKNPKPALYPEEHKNPYKAGSSLLQQKQTKKILPDPQGHLNNTLDYHSTVLFLINNSCFCCL